MVLAHRDPAGVAPHVVDAVRDRLAQVLVREIVDVDPLGLALRLPFPPPVLEGADQLLLLGVHRDHRLAGRQERFDLLVEVAELGIPVGMLAPFQRLGRGLQAVAGVLEQRGHRPIPDPVAPLLQGARQLPGALAGPPQRRHRIAARVRVDQRLQIGQQGRVSLGQRLRPPPTRRTRSGAATDPVNSRSPCWMVGRETPAARATRATPPWPNARASTARNSRRCRSFKYGNSAVNFSFSSRVCVHPSMIRFHSQQLGLAMLFLLRF